MQGEKWPFYRIFTHIFLPNIQISAHLMQNMHGLDSLLRDKKEIKGSNFSSTQRCSGQRSVIIVHKDEWILEI